jgi:hypothetical protein
VLFGSGDESSAQLQSRFGGGNESSAQKTRRAQHGFGGVNESSAQKTRRAQHGFGSGNESSAQLQSQYGSGNESSAQLQSRFGSGNESSAQKEGWKKGGEAGEGKTKIKSITPEDFLYQVQHDNEGGVYKVVRSFPSAKKAREAFGGGRGLYNCFRKKNPQRTWQGYFWLCGNAFRKRDGLRASSVDEMKKLLLS